MRLLQIFIALIPLIFSFSTSDPTLHIRFLSLSCLVILFILINLFSRKLLFIQVFKNPVVICFVVLLCCFLFSFFVNGVSSESIYIILKTFLIFIFFILVVHIFLEHGFKDTIPSFLYFSLLLSAIYFFQLITNYSDIISISDVWERNKEFDKISATMGHKNLLSSIQFLMLPFLIYLFRSDRKLLRNLSIVAIVLIVLIFLQTQTRAVLVAIVLFILSFLFINKEYLRKRHIVAILCSFLGIIIIGCFIMRYTGRYDAFKHELKKISNISEQPRYSLYSSTLDLISDFPLLGVGPGNWKIAIWEYGLYFDSIGNSFAQRPHNDFLWVFAEGGVFAGISYILLFLILLRDSYLLHKCRKEEGGIIYSLLFATVIGYGFISFIDFPMERFSHNIIFFVIASIIISERIKQKGFNKDMLPVWTLYIFLFITCFSFFVGLIRYKGEKNASRGLYYKGKNNWNYVIKAIDNSYNPIYYEMENTSTPLLWYRGVAYFNQKRYSLALEDFKDAYKVNPYHVHVLNNLATSYQMKGDSEKAKKYYRDVFKVHPTFKETRVNLAAILFNEKDYVDALDVILQSKVDPYWTRREDNFKDNYDLYLKTIVRSWVNSVYDKAGRLEKKALEKWVSHFENYGDFAEKKARSIFNIRREKNVDYLTALMLFEEAKN